MIFQDQYRRLTMVLQQAGHVGLWAGMYVCGAYVCFWQLADAGPAGTWPALSAVAAVLLCATAVYAFDRVKLSDRLIDPADQVAHPQRYGFLGQYLAPIRMLAVILIISAMTLAYLASRWMPILIALSVMGVVLYAPGPRGKLPRPKDVLILKNLLVALAVVMLAMVATALVGPLSHVHGHAFWQLANVRIHAILPAVLVLMIRILADAALCDIDDLQSDRQHGTHTLATVLGRQKAFWLAVGIRILFSLMVIVLTLADPSVRYAWATINLVSVCALIVRRNRGMKDVVDLSMLVEAVFCTLFILIIRSSGVEIL